MKRCRFSEGKKLFQMRIVLWGLAATVVLLALPGVSVGFPDANSKRYSVPDAASFFAGVDLAYPGLEAVAAAVEQKDYPAAIEAYCAFVAQRKHPRRIAPGQTFAGNLDRADREIGKYLENGKLRADHVWLGKPAQHYAHRNRMGFLMHIAKAHAESGDDKYLDAFRVIVGAWIKDNPLGIEVPKDFQTPWHILDVSARSSSWTYSLALLQQSERFRSKSVLRSTAVSCSTGGSLRTITPRRSVSATSAPPRWAET
jgi:hypothetical protein